MHCRAPLFGFCCEGRYISIHIQYILHIQYTTKYNCQSSSWEVKYLSGQTGVASTAASLVVLYINESSVNWGRDERGRQITHSPSHATYSSHIPPEKGYWTFASKSTSSSTYASKSYSKWPFEFVCSAFVQSKKALKELLQKCIHLPALEPLLHDAPPNILKHVIGQFSKVLPHDSKARRLFVTSGGLKKVQEINAESGSQLAEYINTINNCFPEEIVKLVEYSAQNPFKCLSCFIILVMSACFTCYVVLRNLEAVHKICHTPVKQGV